MNVTTPDKGLPTPESFTRTSQTFLNFAQSVRTFMPEPVVSSGPSQYSVRTLNIKTCPTGQLITIRLSDRIEDGNITSTELEIESRTPTNNRLIACTFKNLDEQGKPRDSYIAETNSDEDGKLGKRWAIVSDPEKFQLQISMDRIPDVVLMKGIANPEIADASEILVDELWTRLAMQKLTDLHQTILFQKTKDDDFTTDDQTQRITVRRMYEANDLDEITAITNFNTTDPRRWIENFNSISIDYFKETDADNEKKAEYLPDQITTMKLMKHEDEQGDYYVMYVERNVGNSREVSTMDKPETPNVPLDRNIAKRVLRYVRRLDDRIKDAEAKK